MAIAGMAAAYQHPICPLAKGPEDVLRIDPAAAIHAQDNAVRRILLT